MSFTRLSLAILVLLAVASAAVAQQSPRLGYAYPGGGKQGTAVEVLVGGQTLEGATAAVVSGSGVTSEVLAFIRPLTAKETQTLRSQQTFLENRKSAAAKLKDKAIDPRIAPFVKPWTPADEKSLAEIRWQLALGQKRMAIPSLAQIVVVRMTIAADSQPGRRELRLLSGNGLSNPISFAVGQLPEVREEDTRPTTQPNKTPLNLPVTINGQIMPGGVDRFPFNAKKGQKLVLSVSARELMPYIADAVPGWFQAVIALYDEQGKEVAFVDDYRFNPDPVMLYEVPKDGQYSVEIRDSIYRGREDFVYRLSIGELPFVTQAFPLGGRAGEETLVQVRGFNLPVTTVKFDAVGKLPALSSLSVKSGGLMSNAVPFAIDNIAETTEVEPNDSPSSAQSVKLPININGRIGAPGDRDVFRIEGHEGEQIVAEVFARRLGSPMDSILRLTDASGKQLAMNDDHEDKSTGLITHHADSYLTATLPASGTYYLSLAETQHKGGDDYAYRLRIGNPRPDYELRVFPSNITAGTGSIVPIGVHAIRRDGFDGEIKLSLKDAPAGMTMSGASIPAGQERVRLTMTVPATPTTLPVPLHMEGRATIGGHEVVRSAAPSDDRMQAFLYMHLVVTDGFSLLVLPRNAGRPPTLAGNFPVKIPSGGTAQVLVNLPVQAGSDIECQLSEPPEGISVKSAAIGKSGTEIVLACDATKIKPGLKGNLIASINVTLPDEPGKPAGTPKRKYSVGTLPAIAFEVVAP